MISLFRRPGLFWFSSNIKYRILSGLQLLTKIYELLTVLLPNLQRFSDNVSRNENQSNNSLEISPRFEWKLNVRINKVVKVQSPTYLSEELSKDRVNQCNGVPSAVVFKDGRGPNHLPSFSWKPGQASLVVPVCFLIISDGRHPQVCRPRYLWASWEEIIYTIRSLVLQHQSSGWSDFSLLSSAKCWATGPVHLIY